MTYNVFGRKLNLALSTSVRLGFVNTTSVFARPDTYCFNLVSASSRCLGDCLRLETNILTSSLSKSQGKPSSFAHWRIE